MDRLFFYLAALVPLTVVVSFMAHWVTIARVGSAEERLPLCRGAYLSFSVQLSLYAWALCLIGGRRGPGLAVAALAMTLSSLGDVFNLQFPSIKRRVGDPLFLGILCFAAAQLSYIGAFLTKASVGSLLDEGFLAPLLLVFTIAPALLFRFRVYDPSMPRPRMLGAFGYGLVLGAMAAVAVSAAIALGGGWYLVAAGSLSFLLSDAIMGETTMRDRHPRTEFQVPWITYLVAQGLILLGFAVI